MKTCTQCGETLSLDQFAKSGRYLRSNCKRCGNERTREYAQRNKERRNERLREWRRRNPDAARAGDLRARLMRKYRLTPDEVEAMAVAQGGQCFLCGSTDRALVVDHCHETGRVRGLLCRSCNTLVGQIEKSPVILDRVNQYLAHGATSEFASSSNTSP